MTTVARLSPSDAHGMTQLLRIYQTSIEPSEQKTAAEVTAIVADPRYRVLVSQQGDDVTGFAIAFVPSRAQFVLLEYMAVDAKLRGQGTGVALLDAAKIVAHEKHVPLLLEVDQLGAAVSADNDPTRRLRFYAERACKRILGLDYILPLETSGTPPPMWLLVSGRPQALSQEEMREWLTALYVEVYGQDERDPRIELMLSRSGRRDFVLAPIS